MDLKQFGQYFSKLREDSGYKSQRQLAAASGISNGTIARLEDGSQRPRPDTIRTLSSYLNGVSYNDLMGMLGYLDSDLQIETFSKNISKLMNERKIEFDELAKVLGVSQFAIVREGYASIATKENVRKLSDHFNVPIDYFTLDNDEVSGTNTNKTSEVGLAEFINALSTMTDEEIIRNFSHKYRDSNISPDAVKELIGYARYRLGIQKN